ncbi:YetF domain-containing protein, partial [Clostridium beijerinckii]
LTRLMGRKLISQMTFFDFVVGVSMGSMVANLSIGSKNTPITAPTSLITFAILTILTGLMSIKSFKVRKIINSEPVVLINSGHIVQSNMKRVRITIEQLTMQLREKNIFSLADVEFAILETNGQLSVLPKSDKIPLTPSHMNIPTTGMGLMKDIIIDGNIIKENLEAAKFDMQWLQSQLTMNGIQNASDVFYAGVNNTKNIYLSKKSDRNVEKHGKYGIE